MLPSQAGYLKLTYASYLKEWINVKKAFKELTNSFPRGMTEMLSAMNLKLEGRHHSGIGDEFYIHTHLSALNIIKLKTIARISPE